MFNFRELSDHLFQFLILEGFSKKAKMPYCEMYKRDKSNFDDREFDEVVIKGTDWESTRLMERCVPVLEGNDLGHFVS